MRDSRPIPLAAPDKPLDTLSRPLLRKRLIVAAIIVAFAFVQVVGYFQSAAGVFANTALLIALVSIALAYPPLRRPALVLACLPLSVTVMTALPVTNPFIRMFVFYELLFAFGLIYRRSLVHERPFKRKPLFTRGTYKSILLFILGGAILGIIGFLLAPNTDTFSGVPYYILLPCIVMFAISEETYFRGLLQEHATRIFTPDLSLVLVAAIYACFGFNSAAPFAVIFALLSSFILSTIYAYKYNLKLNIIVNSMMKILFVVLMSVF